LGRRPLPSSLHDFPSGWRPPKKVAPGIFFFSRRSFALQTVQNHEDPSSSLRCVYAAIGHPFAGVPSIKIPPPFSLHDSTSEMRTPKRLNQASICDCEVQRRSLFFDTDVLKKSPYAGRMSSAGDSHNLLLSSVKIGRTKKKNTQH